MMWKFGVAFALASITLAVNAKVLPVKTEYRVGNLTVEVNDLTPRFIDFFERAQHVPEDQRFPLWKEYYGFAAVPPTPQGDAMAKQLLAHAWDRYPAALARLKQGAGVMQPRPEEMIGKVARLYKFEGTARIRVNIYVGGFEDNAYTMKAGDTPVVALPLESPKEFIELVGLHEATHAVHMLTANLSGDFERPVARVILEEGLAMRTVAALRPGKSDAYYMEHRPGWLATAQTKRLAILKDMLPLLAKRDGQTVFSVTMGEGKSGLQREAYYAGWLVVGELQRQGMTLQKIAHIPEAEMIPLVEKTLRRLIRRR